MNWSSIYTGERVHLVIQWVSDGKLWNVMEAGKHVSKRYEP